MSFDPSQSRCNAPLWTPCSALHKTTTQWSSIAHACSCKSQRLDPIALITGQRACTPRLPIGLPLNPTTEKPCATKRPLLSHAAAAASSSSYASSAARSHISLLPREAFGGALGGCASPATRIASHSIDSAPADTRKDGTCGKKCSATESCGVAGGGVDIRTIHAEIDAMRWERLISDTR
eukprot:2682704-Pleurochrysis_carterae.AAC.2